MIKTEMIFIGPRIVTVVGDMGVYWEMGTRFPTKLTEHIRRYMTTVILNPNIGKVDIEDIKEGNLGTITNM